MSTGFGTQPFPIGDQGVEANVPDQEPFEQMAQDIHAIKTRYVQPQTIEPIPQNFTAYQAIPFKMTGTLLNAIMVTVASGVLYGYFGDFSSQSGKAPPTPHFCVSAGVVPVTTVFVLPPGDNYTFTLQEGNNSTAAGCITPMYI